MHNPHFGVAIEGVRPAHAEHLLAARMQSKAFRKAHGAFRLGLGPFSSEDALTSLYGLADGLCVGIDDLAFGMGRATAVAQDCLETRWCALVGVMSL